LRIWLSQLIGHTASPDLSYGRLLSSPSRYEMDGFLKNRGVWLEYTLEDFPREGEITAPLLAERKE
jgi:hypothetical protein